MSDVIRRSLAAMLTVLMMFLCQATVGEVIPDKAALDESIKTLANCTAKHAIDAARQCLDTLKYIDLLSIGCKNQAAAFHVLLYATFRRQGSSEERAHELAAKTIENTIRHAAQQYSDGLDGRAAKYCRDGLGIKK